MLIRGFLKRVGSAAVETALVLPLLFLLIFATIDFGRYFFVQHTLQHAVREGVKTGMVGKSGGGASREASIDDVVRKNACMTGIECRNKNKLVVTVYPLGFDEATRRFFEPSKAPPDNSLDAGAGGQYMKIKAKYEFSSVTGILGRNTRWISAEGVYQNQMF